MFHIGQKVICIETAYTNTTLKGRIYTIIDINECCEVNLYLDGINHNHALCRCGVQLKGSPNSGKRFIPLDDYWSGNVLDKIIEQIEVDELVAF